jgi:hypothetical protein
LTATSLSKGETQLNPAYDTSTDSIAKREDFFSGVLRANCEIVSNLTPSPDDLFDDLFSQPETTTFAVAVNSPGVVGRHLYYVDPSALRNPAGSAFRDRIVCEYLIWQISDSAIAEAMEALTDIWQMCCRPPAVATLRGKPKGSQLSAKRGRVQISPRIILDE